MVTVYDVAARAGVSIGTVSRYLTGNGYVGEATQGRIAAAIDELGYVRNRAAASLTTKSTGLLGFVVSDLRNPFVAEIASALSVTARAAGYGLMVSESGNDPAASLQSLELMRTHGVDGVIVTPPESPELNDALVRAARTIPVVGIGLRTEPLVSDTVTSDTEGGARAAVEHLVALGHTRIAYLGLAKRGAGRFRGFQRAVAASGTAVGREVFLDQLTHQDGAAALRRMVADGDLPSAIFAANDAVALGVLQTAGQEGIAVPRDLSVVGFDDIAMAANAAPPLTTVAQPTAEMGAAAIQMALTRLRSDGRDLPPREAVLAARLIVRESSAVAGDASRKEQRES
ncbi:MAG: LacI family DNA-binding transcriptional regulator [Arachnia sp.]